MRTYLASVYDSRESFGNKAEVESDYTGKTTLYSYLTPVAVVKSGTVQLLRDWDASATTLRHVKEFLKQNGFKADSKQQMQRDYS